MYNRYGDIEKLITDPDQLRMVNGSEVYISSEDDYDIVVDLQGHTEDFEGLKPFIIFIAQSICELDNIAQKFDSLFNKGSRFSYDLEIVFIDKPYVILEYWETEVNSQFDVVFEHNAGRFTLKSFGTILDIPPDWEHKEPAKTQPVPKKGFLRTLMKWLQFCI